MKYILPVLIAVSGFLIYDNYYAVVNEQNIVDKEKKVIPVDKKAEIIQVVFETNVGEIIIDLEPEKAPITVENFLAYVDNGFYSNTLFHRVIPSFMIQGGGFEKEMKIKRTRATINNESFNGLLNERGTISMARKNSPNSATSQFFINIKNNRQLDANGKKAGYAVFGKVSQGMDVVDKIALTPTLKAGQFSDVPKDDIVILSVKRKQAVAEIANEANKEKQAFIAGEHYIVLDEPYATRDSSKIEVLEAFSYGCGHCYGIDPDIEQWLEKQPADVDFVRFPAIWNSAMTLYSQAFYTAVELKVHKLTHQPLFEAIVVEQKKLSNATELASFFEFYGVSKKLFIETFNSPKIKKLVELAKVRTTKYTLASVPEVIVNGKYRVNPMRAGGQQQLFELVDFLVDKERQKLIN